MPTGPLNARLLAIALVIVLLSGALSCVEEEPGPRAWIDFPEEGASVPLGSPVRVLSHAYAEEGVAEVMLSIDGEPYRRDAPAEAGATFTEVIQDWFPEQAKTYTLRVTTYDATGAASAPASVSVTVVDAAAKLATPPDTAPTPTWTPIYPGSPTPPTPTPTQPTFTPPPTPPTPTPTQPTRTPTPTPTQPTRTPTPTPTRPTRTPTVTPTRTPEADIRFWADDYSLRAGKCTRVHWHVTNVSAYWVNDEDGAGDDGEFQRCPCEEETHTLRAELLDGSQQTLSLTIEVSGECLTPTPTPTLTPWSEPPPVSVPVPSPFKPHYGAELDCSERVLLTWDPIEPPGGTVQYLVKLERRLDGNWQPGSAGPTNFKEVEVRVECDNEYRWAVRAQDAEGNYSEWSELYHFTVKPK